MAKFRRREVLNEKQREWQTICFSAYDSDEGMRCAEESFGSQRKFEKNGGYRHKRGCGEGWDSSLVKRDNSDNKVTIDPIEAGYNTVYLWAVVEKAKSFDVDKLKKAADSLKKYGTQVIW